MSERVLIRQNNAFQAVILATDPEVEESDLKPAMHLFDVSPYGMLLISLGTCTSILLHSYAQNHGIGLELVEIELAFERVFDEDCENCETIDRYDEQIRMELAVQGKLSEADQRRLRTIASQCPIDKMLREGMKVEILERAEPTGSIA